MRLIADIVAAYSNDRPIGDGRRKDMRQFLRWYEQCASLPDAMTKAVLGNHPHQHCLSKKKLRRVEAQLQANATSICAALTFKDRVNA